MKNSVADGASVSRLGKKTAARQSAESSLKVGPAPTETQKSGGTTLVLDAPPAKFFEFDGKLIINSDIPDDVHIKAGKGLEVNGDVGASFLEAGGNIKVKNLYGKGLSLIKCAGSFRADSVFDAFVESDGDIDVGNSVKSSLKSSDSIRAGSFVGGEAIAKNKVRIKKAGSPDHLETHISASLDFRVSDRISAIKARVAQIHDELAVLEKHLGAYAKDIEEAYDIKDQKKRDKVLDMIVKKIKLEHAVKTKLESELRRLNMETVSAPESEIHVDDVLLNGVVVEIGRISRRLENDLKGPVGISADVENNSLKFKPK